MWRGGALLTTPGGRQAAPLQRGRGRVRERGRFGCGYVALGAKRARPMRQLLGTGKFFFLQRCGLDLGELPDLLADPSLDRESFHAGRAVETVDSRHLR